jgi:hypothetical protein
VCGDCKISWPQAGSSWIKAIGYFPNTETTYALMDSQDQAMLSLYGCTTISGIPKGVTEFPSPRLMTAPALLSFPMTLI